jgi:hypothetical protein
MKKAKIMLSAIAAFAVVGGALAFKAHTNNKNSTVTYKFCVTLNGANTCDSKLVHNATDIATVTSTSRDVTVTDATLDPNLVTGGSCTDATHPCTATVYYQDGQAF